ncbi:transposable element Tcb2 transposase [Trichonephila clavipes]|nr:transposable element Tcb2 transposase [Trichonephila clavipes]
MDSACQVGTLQGHGCSILVWGVFSWHVLGNLVRVPTSLNVMWYVELLGIISICLCCFVIRTVMEFSSKTTVSLRILGWLSGHSSNFSVVNCPPRSSDLNPIGHWEVLEQGLKCHHTSPKNLTELCTLPNIW